MDGKVLLSWMSDLFPMNRSLSGDGNRETLAYLNRIVPEIATKSFSSGEKVFDWTIPEEWNIRDAYIETMDGRKFAQFKQNNLHLVGYSTAINKIVTKEELLEHLYFMEDYPHSIPYVTSYYARTWGFCISYEEYKDMGDGPFRVYIDSSFKSGEEGGVLNYGEAYLPGISSQEVLFSTYICHPSMANNELSGPVVASALALSLRETNHYYSYRFLFLPETIGSIAYLSRNLNLMKSSVVAGWVLTCLGDGGVFSYIPSRTGANYADKISRKILRELYPEFREYTWLDRGSDERQYCSPGVDLPICSITRSKYGTYPEYHTSADNLHLITEASIMESVNLFQAIVTQIESTRVPKVKILCEPQLGKRGLYPNLSKRDAYSANVKNLQDVISYLDGQHTIEEIAQLCEINQRKVLEILEILLREDLLYT